MCATQWQSLSNRIPRGSQNKPLHLTSTVSGLLYFGQLGQMHKLAYEKKYKKKVATQEHANGNNNNVSRNGTSSMTARGTANAFLDRLGVFFFFRFVFCTFCLFLQW